MKIQTGFTGFFKIQIGPQILINSVNPVHFLRSRPRSHGRRTETMKISRQ
jgi:hypothetical protein